MSPSEFIYFFEEGVSGSDVCVQITTNDDGSCPVDFTVSITLNIRNLLDTCILVRIYNTSIFKLVFYRCATF